MNEELKYHVALQLLYERLMGPWQMDDRWVDPDTGQWGIVRRDTIRIIPSTDLLRTPLTIDDRNPERGLWGMVSFEKYHPDINGYGGILFIRRTDGEPVSDTWDAPTLALLKALAVQEGVEV